MTLWQAGLGTYRLADSPPNFGGESANWDDTYLTEDTVSRPGLLLDS